MSQVETSQGAGQPRAERGGYDAAAAEAKWQRFWAEDRTFVARDDDPRERRYMLDMFPYPSGDLHMGHAEAYAMGDVLARIWRMQGYNVMHPIGWDAFGLPAENAAIRNDEHPSRWTYENIETQKKSFKRYGLSLDWSREIHTCDEEYYRWTQWLFLQFFRKGLAYRKDGYVNWCPTDQTVLANEQVKEGLCERCGSVVTKRELTQWYFRITDYAQELLDDMGQLEGTWPDRVLAMQRNWIGRSEGLGDVRRRGPRRAHHRLHHAPRHAPRRQLHGRRPRRPAGRGDRLGRVPPGLRGVPRAGQEDQ